MGSTGGLKPAWKAGQSGNPRGGSRKRSQQRQAREWLEAITKQKIPPDLLERIRQEAPSFGEMIPDDATFGFAMALKINLIALMGTPTESLAAFALVEKVTPENPPDPASRPRPPMLPSTEEQRREIAAELGIEVETRTVN